MFDPAPLFPDGFHPVFAHYLPDLSGAAYPIPRSSVDIKYYFIDFGISRLYDPGDEHLVVGDDGADQDVPEMSNVDEYDPFPADVFILGNVFRKHFIPVSTTSSHSKFLITDIFPCTSRNTRTLPSSPRSPTP